MTAATRIFAIGFAERLRQLDALATAAAGGWRDSHGRPLDHNLESRLAGAIAGLESLHAWSLRAMPPGVARELEALQAAAAAARGLHDG